MAAAAGFGAAVGLSRPDVGVWVALVLMAVVAAVFLVPLVFYGVSVAVHELGHFLVGLLVGMRFRSVTVCGLSLRNTSAGPRWTYDSRLANSGEVQMDFPVRGNALNRYRLHVLGGPLATITLLGASGYLLVATYPGNYETNAQSITSLLLLIIVVVNLYLAAGTVFPRTIQGVANDAQILVLLSRPDAKRTVALSQLSILVHDAVRAKEWPNSLLTTALSFQEGSEYEASARYYNYYHLLDRDEPDRAWEQIDRATEIILAQVQVNDEVKLGILIERAFAAAWAKRDLSLSQRLGVEFADKDVPEHLLTGTARLGAAVSLLEQRPDAAFSHLARFDETVEATESVLGHRIETDRAFVEAMRAEAIEMVAKQQE